MKLRVHMNGEEWYPVYDIFEAADGKYEIDSGLLERYQATKAQMKDLLKEVDEINPKDWEQSLEQQLKHLGTK